MINFKNNQKFGIEIEFYGVLREKVQFELQKQGFIDKGWIVKPEFIISGEENNDYKGEINSPILSNDIDDLKQVLKILKNFEAKSDYNCASHIHFDASRLNYDNVYYLQNLMLLFLAYEEIIFKYSAGEMQNIREYAFTHAKPLMLQLDYEIEEYFYSDIDYTDFYYYIEQSDRKSSLNLSNLRHSGLQTIEFRTPNGTLNDFIWQNNINTFGLMIDFATKMDCISREFLYEEIKKQKTLGFDDEFINLKKAKEFISLIKVNENDEINFLKQYQKTF